MTLSFSVAEAPADPSASAGRHVPQDAVAKVGKVTRGLKFECNISDAYLNIPSGKLT